MRYFATAIPGSPVLAREIEELPGARAVQPREFDGRNDLVPFMARGPAASSACGPQRTCSPRS